MVIKGSEKFPENSKHTVLNKSSSLSFPYISSKIAPSFTGSIFFLSQDLIFITLVNYRCFLNGSLRTTSTHLGRI